MNPFLKNRIRDLLTLVLAVAVFIGTATNVHAASKANKKINNTYGYITGEVKGSIFCGAKNINSYARTGKNVPRLMTSVEVQYYNTGKKICDEGTEWRNNVRYAGVDVDLIHFKNALKGKKYDGFLHTKLTAYGCAEAIVKKSYTVYTTCVY